MGAFATADKVQRELNFAIVDEVDSILIDEARTPLIISGPAESSTDLYAQINKLIPKLKKHEETDDPTGYDIPADTVLIDGNEMSITAGIEYADERDSDIAMTELVDRSPIVDCWSAATTRQTKRPSRRTLLKKVTCVLKD